MILEVKNIAAVRLALTELIVVDIKIFLLGFFKRGFSIWM